MVFTTLRQAHFQRQSYAFYERICKGKLLAKRGFPKRNFKTVHLRVRMLPVF